MYEGKMLAGEDAMMWDTRRIDRVDLIVLALYIFCILFRTETESRHMAKGFKRHFLPKQVKGQKLWMPADMCA